MQAQLAPFSMAVTLASCLLITRDTKQMHNHAFKTCFYPLCRMSLFASLTNATADAALRSQVYNVEF